MSGQTQLSILVPKSFLARAESMCEWAAGESEITTTGNASRAAVLRAAMRIGLGRLERRQARANTGKGAPETNADE